MPLLSIVTTVYDRADALASCLRSVVNLDWQDYEHIVVADHPPDDAFAALERVVAEAGDARVSLCNLPERTNDLGISPARAGLRRARGKYLAFLDDDNVYLPGHFNALIDCLESNPGLGFAYSACLWNAELLLNSPSPAEGRIDLGQVLFRRELFRIHLDDELRYSGYTWDWQLIADLLNRGVSFRFIDQETFVFRAAQYPRLAPEPPLESARKRIAELVRAGQHARREFAEALRRAEDEAVGQRLRAEQAAQQAAGARQDLERVHDLLSHAHRALEGEHEKLAKAHRELQTEHDGVSRGHRRLEHERDQLAKHHRALQVEHERLSHAHHGLAQDRDALAKAHQALQVEHERLSRSHRGLEQERDALAKDHRELQVEHERLSHTHSGLARERDGLAKTHRDLEATLARASHVRQSLEQERDQLARARQELQAECARLEKARAALQYRLESVLGSRIWRATAPLRALLDGLRGGS